MALFALGKLQMTPELLKIVSNAGLSPDIICGWVVEQHLQGKWGDINPNQKTVNEVAVQLGKGIVKSSHTLEDVGDVWIMTDLRGTTTYLMIAGQELKL
jgi:hypothetical protein